MPNRELLENYPLYRKLPMDLPNASQLARPAIHMDCPVCGSGQTFNMTVNAYPDIGWNEPPQGVSKVVYRCASCEQFDRFFLLKFDPERNYVIKVGQEPPWDISVDRNLEKTLGEYTEYYKKGLICESQGYGIGAFAYYRRIVEEVIDALLAGIADLMGGEDHERYLEALEQVKEAPIAQDKIALVKDLLPPILRPGGMNPLSTLHSVLSEGLHKESDDHCMELAMTVREVLEFLVNQIFVTRTAATTFTESMRKLLDRRKE